jgi:energy-coupling factor transporter ATP-binding protein EcfA2
MSRHDLLNQLGLPITFPEFFPAQLEQYRRSLSEATDTPDEFGVAYMLAGGGTAAGADVSACVQNGWCVRANLFVAIVGYKGSGKTTLRNKVLAPLVRHEDALREQAALDYDEDEYDEDGDDEDGYDGGGGRGGAEKCPEPCVIVNDCTGPAVLRLLEHNQRQLLVNADEISTLFIRNTGGTDRQMWCELYEGLRRRQQRASASGLSTTLAAPYVSILGGIQPDLLKCMYGSRGDDGFLDRLLLVGDGVPRQVSWPRDADDPGLNAAWADVVDRLLHVEELARDSLGEQVEARFTPAALETCQQLEHRLNQMIVLIGIPGSQFGVVGKLRQHAVKLALLHRCFRWAAGEFGEQGPMGDVDADDAAAACEATLFFFGRWLIWRPELRGGHGTPSGTTVGLASAPGSDPALLALAAAAAGDQSAIRLIEKLVRYGRHQGQGPIRLAAFESSGLCAGATSDEIHGACQWLVQRGLGEWIDDQAGKLRLFGSSDRSGQSAGSVTAERGRRRRPDAQLTKAVAATGGNGKSAAGPARTPRRKNRSAVEGE